MSGQSRTAMSDLSQQVLGALALELAPGSAASLAALPQGEAGVLAAAMARDLALFAPEAAGLECVMAGAHYDPVELLRPGWPIHRELHQLAARAPLAAGASGRIIAFGMHAAQLPGALAPATEHAGGPLRLVPFLLAGEAAVVARVGDLYERDLMERGMAGAETALVAQEAFGLRVEHARYLTLHDLCALTAMQYEHAGLAPLWPLLETALLSPDREAWLDAPPEPLLHYNAGEVRIALFSPDAWRGRYRPKDHAIEDGAILERAFGHFEARQRQFAAVLAAHGVPVTFVHCDNAAEGRTQLA